MIPHPASCPSPSSPRSPLNARGLSLIEVVTGLAIAALLVTLAVPVMGGAQRRRVFEGIAAELATDLRYARAEAVARQRSVVVSFEADATHSCYTIHTGASAACHCLAGAPGDSSTCNAGASDIKTVRMPADGNPRLESNSDYISFSAVNGSAAPFATISLIGPRGVQIDHVVSATGRVRSCVRPAPGESSPAATSLGYRVC